MKANQTQQRSAFKSIDLQQSSSKPNNTQSSPGRNLTHRSQSPFVQMFSTNEDGNNKMFSLQDYMMKQKRQKSVFSLSKTVKRLFFLDFSTKSFYYKHQASDTDCKTISSFKDIRDVQEFDHPHQDIIRKWPYALKIITNSQVDY